MNTVTGGLEHQSINIQDINIEQICSTRKSDPGKQTILFLHPEIGLGQAEPTLAMLDKFAPVYAPSHPGFGKSELPRWMSSVDDLAYFYLDYMDALDLRNVILIGCSLGGWIASEIAVRNTSRISHLVLAGASGIKVSDREHSDFVDQFNVSHQELDQLSFHNPSFRTGVLKDQSEQALTQMFRNRESTGLFCWSPYMYNPMLRRRLHRIDRPTLILWGGQDQIVGTDYGRVYSREISAAQFSVIDQSGHYPHIEQPEVFIKQIANFCELA